jgi:hypothetical protein
MRKDLDLDVMRASTAPAGQATSHCQPRLPQNHSPHHCSPYLTLQGACCTITFFGAESENCCILTCLRRRENPSLTREALLRHVKRLYIAWQQTSSLSLRKSPATPRH